MMRRVALGTTIAFVSAICLAPAVAFAADKPLPIVMQHTIRNTCAPLALAGSAAVLLPTSDFPAISVAYFYLASKLAVESGRHFTHATVSKIAETGLKAAASIMAGTTLFHLATNILTFGTASPALAVANGAIDGGLCFVFGNDLGRMYQTENEGQIDANLQGDTAGFFRKLLDGSGEAQQS